MKANIMSKNTKEVVLQVKISLESTMLKTEESIQQSLNQAGCLATEIALSRRPIGHHQKPLWSGA